MSFIFKVLHNLSQYIFVCVLMLNIKHMFKIWKIYFPLFYFAATENSMPIGIFMANRKRSVPNLVTLSDDDSDFSRSIKAILPRMLEYNSASRPYCEEVMQVFMAAKGIINTCIIITFLFSYRESY